MSAAADLARLARLGNLVADELERRQYQAAPVVRRMAAELASARQRPPDATTCVCGAEIVQSARGRRRTFCTTACRQRHHRQHATKSRRNGEMSS